MDTDKAGSGGELVREAVYYADGLEARADYLANQENDVVGVVFTVGVGFAFDFQERSRSAACFLSGGAAWAKKGKTRSFARSAKFGTLFCLLI